MVATAERKIGLFDCRKLSQAMRWTNSPLKFQSRCLAVFPDASGFALGSVEVKKQPNNQTKEQKSENMSRVVLQFIMLILLRATTLRSSVTGRIRRRSLQLTLWIFILGMERLPLRDPMELVIFGTRTASSV